MRIIYIALYNEVVPQNALCAAKQMGEAFGQEVRWLVFDGVQPPSVESALVCDDATWSNVAETLERNDASMLIFELPQKPTSRAVQRLLNGTRNLRIPYMFLKQGQTVDFSSVVATVSFLEEDKEKAAFAAAFGRQMASRLTLVTANDYGSKAMRHTDAIASLFDSFGLDYVREKSRKDSFGIDREVVADAVVRGFGLIIVSASREYGIDDWLFGPKERHLILRSQVPLLLINPRGDLYALCD